MDELRRVQIQQITAAVAPRHCPLQVRGLAIAYSGGPDSTVLLHALAHAGHTCPVRAVHVCHNLQPAARAWVAHCREFCNRLGVAFTSLDVQVEPGGEGIEAAARRARYAALGAELQAGEVLVLAQHANDQAETFLLQALRGAGVAGLAAMPAHAPFADGHLWRPLLRVPRVAVLAYGETYALPVVADPSNRDPQLERGYMRTQLWPALSRRWPQAATTLTRAAGWCAEASALVAEVAAADLTQLQDAQQRIAVAPLQQLSRFRQGNVVRQWLGVLGFDAPDHRHVDEILRLLQAREHAGPVVRWRNTEVRLFDAHLHAMRVLPPVPQGWCRQWQPAQDLLHLPPGCGQLRAEADGDLAQLALAVRLRRGGERYHDARRGGTRTLKAFLQEQRIAPWLRQRLPLIYHQGRLVAIADYWQDPALAAQLRVRDLRFIWQRGA